MLFSGKIFPHILIVIFALPLVVLAQDVTSEINIREGGTVEIVNLYGRIAVKAEAAADEKAVVGRLNASLPNGVAESAIKVSGGSGRIVITVEPAEKNKRIDLTLILPERTKIKVETRDGAVEAVGNFASIEAKTYTGTIAIDVPDDDLKYQFVWTESKPRYLADFEIAEVKEKAAGRFEVRGRKGEREKGRKGDTEKDQSSVSLNFTTARGIVLLNVPPSEVMSDLRERPLTNAAKAIIRSGDSLLMEAIRRASPKYFGDYARTLPPFERQPSLVTKTERINGVMAPVKTALVRVTDINNRAIAGLDAKDFEVTENGVSRDIVSVMRSTASFNLVLLLDVSGSVENYVNFIRKAARSFVNTVDKNDRVSIVTFNDDVKVISKFTTDKGKLSESLDTFDAGGGTAYYDALAYTIADTLRQVKGERTAIVILTDGDDNRSFLPFDALLGSIQESGSLIYPLYVPSGLIAATVANPNFTIDPMRAKYMSLTAKSIGEGERLAKVSGGVYYPITQISQIQQAYEDIVVQLRTAYNVTFRSETAATKSVSPRLKIKTKSNRAFATVTSLAPTNLTDE